jgi:hypothetical protein
MDLLLSFLSNINEEESMREIIIFLNHLITNATDRRRELFSPFIELMVSALINVLPKARHLAQNVYISLFMVFISAFLEEFTQVFPNSLNSNT